MFDSANNRKDRSNASDSTLWRGPQTEVEISPVFRDKTVVAAVLANHGTIGVGSTLMKAQYLAEIIEETAHIAFVRDTLLAAHGAPKPAAPKFGTAIEAAAG